MSGVPSGLCRVIEYELDTYHERCLGDYFLDEAVSLANTYSMGRNDPMSPVYFVYDHNGEIIRSE